jgi:hypothetical protein
MRSIASRIAACALVAGALAGCGADDENQDAAGARALFARIRSEDYRSWQRAPGYDTRRPSRAPHGDEVDIFIDPTFVDALAGAAIDAWPTGAIVAKDGYVGSTLHIVAIMEKRGDGWFFTELDGSGEPQYSGRPSICTDCHVRGSDYVQAFDFPR